MAIISPSTFDPLKQYVAVRLQQGVPIVDADWNEADDVRRFELRAYLKWFVGDGVPEGNHGFRIAGTGASDDFIITGRLPTSEPGVLHGAGRCIVDGLDVVINDNVSFRSQPLHVSQPNATALAAAWGVPVIAELGGGGTPPAPGLPDGTTIVIYLDVWERLVTPSEDPTLVFSGLGTESCARVRREWAVRWRAFMGIGVVTDHVPMPGAPDYVPGHSYLALASFPGPTGGVMPPITSTTPVDLRPRRLLMLPTTLVDDTLGVPNPMYRLGGGRPVTDLRAAINALLRGELPGTAERAIEANPGGEQSLMDSVVLDAQGGAVAFWTNKTFGSSERQIHAARLDPNNVALGYGTPAVLTASGADHKDPSVTRLPNGDLVLFYTSSTNALLYQRGVFGGTETTVATVGPGELGVGARTTFVGYANNVVLFIYTTALSASWAKYRRLRVSDDTWLDSAPVSMPSIGLDTANLSNSVVDSSGRLWLAGSTSAGIKVLVTDIASGGLVFWVQPSNSMADDGYPFVVQTADGNVCVLWGSDSRESLFGALVSSTDGTILRQFELPTPGKRVFNPSAVPDGSERLSIYYAITNVMSQPHALQLVGLNLSTGVWGTPRSITPIGNNFRPFPLLLPNKSTLLHWNVSQAAMYKQVITQI
jgi:hypothetical protein